MQIVVCIKHVPDTNDIKWSKENNLVREGMCCILNPYDEYALDCALNIKDKTGAFVTVISMGPNQAKDILEYSLAMGANRAILLSDKKFAGSDTVATSKVLANAIKLKVPDAKLIVCGQFAIDGDTAQTGPAVASRLKIPQATYVKEVINANNNSIIVKQEIEEGYNITELKTPALICILKRNEKLPKPKISGYVFAQRRGVEVYCAQDLNLSDEEIGIKGSPTYVCKAFRPQIERNVCTVENNFADKILSIINKGFKNE